jgi:hypothetical protein
MDVDDESLDMNVFEKVMEGKHKEIVSNDDGDSMRINSTSNLFHFGQNNMTDKSCLDNNNYYYYDEIAYPFSKRNKLKHEPEAAQENKPLQYSADIIVEIKIRDGTAVPMGDFLDTGTTDTTILRELVGKGRACTNTKKNQVGKTWWEIHHKL